MAMSRQAEPVIPYTHCILEESAARPGSTLIHSSKKGVLDLLV